MEFIRYGNLIPQQHDRPNDENDWTFHTHHLANTVSMLSLKDSSSRFFSVESVAAMSVTVVSNS